MAAIIISPDDARVLSVSLFQAMETLAHADAHLHSHSVYSEKGDEKAKAESQITTSLFRASQVVHSSCELALARVEPFYTARNHEITDSDSISCRSLVTSALANAEIVAAALEHASKNCFLLSLPVFIVCGDAAMRSAIDAGDLGAISLAVVLLLELPVSVPLPPLVQLVHHALSLRNSNSSSSTTTEVKARIVRVLLFVPEIAASANNADADGNTALMLASSYGNTDAVITLLACPAVFESAGARDIYGDTALMRAAVNGHTETVAALLACPLVVLSAGAQNACLNSALMLASWKGHTKIVVALLACHIVVQSAGDVNKSGSTALMCASFNGHAETVAALLACPTVFQTAGADNKYCETALMLASRNGHTETVIALLAYPTVVQSAGATNVVGDTALMLAVECGYSAIVTALLACPQVMQSAGAANRHGKTALMIAQRNWNDASAQRNEYDAIIALLLSLH